MNNQPYYTGDPLFDSRMKCVVAVDMNGCGHLIHIENLDKLDPLIWHDFIWNSHSASMSLFGLKTGVYRCELDCRYSDDWNVDIGVYNEKLIVGDSDTAMIAQQARLISATAAMGFYIAGHDSGVSHRALVKQYGDLVALMEI